MFGELYRLFDEKKSAAKDPDWAEAGFSRLVVDHSTTP
jgi:hypothetical protein